MDTVKMGKFLAGLRKEQGLTQQQLAEELGVTDKTISRWETGAYLPPVDMLQLLAERYGITVDQLLNGRSNDRAEQKSAVLPRESSFTPPERMQYYRRKWEQDHRASLIAGIVTLAMLFAAGILWNGVLCALATVLVPLFGVIRNNKKMAYAEWKTYVEPRLGSMQDTE